MDEATERSVNLTAVPRANPNVRAADDLDAMLERARRFCAESGDGFAKFATRIAELSERLSEERFHLAVLGQFKRGKSTLLNALLGEPLLPTGVVPLTSIPTFLRVGESRAVRIFFYDGRHADFADLTLDQAKDILSRHVTEKENPRNQLGVERVEVDCPSLILGAGVVLIDTPGIGSTFRHNTEATLSFLPQCDAALFVVSADPPITEVEQQFLNAVRPSVAKLCFVMNKVDYLSESELGDAMAFFEKALQESSVQNNGATFRVSAKRGIEARMTEDVALWRESGLDKLQSYLLDFLSREKARTLRMAIARKATDILGDAALNVGLQQRALKLSREDLERRVESFNDTVGEVGAETIKMGDLLAGDKKRTVQWLENLTESLRGEARRHLGALVQTPFQSDESLVAIEERARERLGEEVPLYFGAKLAALSSETNRVLEAALVPYAERLDQLLNTLRFTAAKLFDIPYRAPVSGGAFEARHKPYWITQKWNTSISPFPEGFTDRLLPAKLRKQRMQKRLAEEVGTVVSRNVENIHWATLRNLDEGFRRIASAIDERLGETAEAIRGAVNAAHLRQRQNEAAAGPEMRRLSKQAGELAELENLLVQYAER